METTTINPHGDTHYVYRVWRDNLLLYVGITNNPSQRMSGHRVAKDWWPTVTRVDATPYSTRAEAAAAEKRAIQSESPVHNVTHAPAVVTPNNEPMQIPEGLSLLEGLTWASGRVRDIDAQSASAVASRNQAIHDAHSRGSTIAEMSRATGLTRTMLYKILSR